MAIQKQLKTLEINSADELKAWKQKWCDAFFADRLTTLHSSYFFLANEFLYFNPDNSKKLALQHCNGELTGIMLYEKKNLSFKGLKLPVSFISVGSEYTSDALINSDYGAAVIQDFMMFLKKKHSSAIWVQFDRTPNEQLPFFINTKGFLGLMSQNSNAAKFKVEQQSLLDFQKTISKKFKKNLDYCERTLQKRFTSVKVELCVHPRNTENNTGFLKKFIAIEDSGWKNKVSGSIQAQPNKTHYMKHLVTDALSDNAIQWCQLVVDDKPIAMLMLFHRQGKIWIYKTTYNEDFKQYSPGAIILTHTLEALMSDSNIHEVDMITDYDWLTRWKPSLIPYSNFQFFQRSILGYFAYLLKRLKSKSFTPIKHLRKRKRRNNLQAFSG